MGKRVLTVGSSLDELTEVEAECGAIAECFPNQIIQPLLVGHRATEGLLRHYAPQSWLVHFAGHAEYPEQQDRRPGQLALQLSKRPWNYLVPPTDNNGELTIAEIYDMDLHRCEAVVLSDGLDRCKIVVSDHAGGEIKNIGPDFNTLKSMINSKLKCLEVILFQKKRKGR